MASLDNNQAHCITSPIEKKNNVFSSFLKNKLTGNSTADDRVAPNIKYSGGRLKKWPTSTFYHRSIRHIFLCTASIMTYFSHLKLFLCAETSSKNPTQKSLHKIPLGNFISTIFVLLFLLGKFLFIFHCLKLNIGNFFVSSKLLIKRFTIFN